MYETIETETRAGAFRIGMKGPLGRRMHIELSEVFREANESSAPVVVLTGLGETFLIAPGKDYREAENQDVAIWIEIIRQGEALIRSMLNLDKPLVVRANGDAAGTGFTVLLAGDIVVAKSGARFVDGHVQRGIACGDGAAIIWPFLIGMSRAKEILFRSMQVTAEEALGLGLVNYVVPESELDAKVQEIVDDLAAQPPVALAYTKKALNGWLQLGMSSMLTEGLMMEGVSAFIRDREKRGRNETVAQ